MAPGQGVKNWNDGLDLVKNWPRAEHIYDRVLKATGVDVIEVCESSEPITDPSVIQPAALAIGYARADFLRNEIVKPDYLMGLSAGEFTVAAISKALSLEDAAMLAHKRGLFQQQVAGGRGGSVLVMHHRGSTQIKKIEKAIEDLQGVNIANYHTPLKTGIAFCHESYQELKERLSIPGIRKVIDVANLHFPPHGPEVSKAQEMLSTLFRQSVTVKNAAIPIVANKSGRLMKSGRTIKKNLIWQTTSPTQLSKGMAYLINKGVEDYYDLGPDSSMSKLLGDFVSLYGINVHQPKSSK